MAHDKPTSSRSRSNAPVPRRGITDHVLLILDVLMMAAFGAAHSLPMAHSQAWWLQLICVGALAFRVSRAAAWRAALLGLAFGTAWLSAGVWWLYVSMNQYGGLSPVLASSAVVGLSLFLSLYLAIAMALFARLRRNRPLVDTLLFAGFWLLAELARGVIFTGFPWAASGYAHVDSPLARLAPWVGVYGIGFVSAVLGSVVAMGSRVRGQALTGGLVGLLFSGVVLGLLGISEPAPHTLRSGKLQLSLLQTNVPQNEKNAGENAAKVLDWMASQMKRSKADLVLAPETVVLLQPEHVPESYWDGLKRHFQGGQQAVLFGMIQGDAQSGYSNSAVGISRDTTKMPNGAYRYDKQHLVPFGEFTPSGFRWFTGLMNIPLGDNFNRGPRLAPSFLVKGERVAPTICYEDLFGEEIAARFAEESVAPTVLANLTNIGWFGDTIVLNQHLQIARMRALEFEIPMVRSTNTGTTAVIDHTGKVTHVLPSMQEGVLEASVEGRRGLTPFAQWASQMSLWPLLALVIAPVLMAVPLRRRADEE